METLKVGTAARLAPSDLAAAVIAPLIGLPGSSPHTTAFFNRRFERLDPCRARPAAILAGDPIGEDEGALDDHDRRDRECVVTGTRVSVRVEHGVRRSITKQ